MELLDLTRHGPMQWRGKLVQVNGSEYVVGEQVGQGASAIVLKLINRRSQLCLHVLRLYRKQEEAVISNRISMEKVGFLIKNGSTDVPWVINIDLPGGLAQLVRYIGHPEPKDAPTSKLLERITELVHRTPLVAFDPGAQLGEAARRDMVEAIELCRATLEINPHHTHALHQLALSLAQLHDWNNAASLQKEVLSIEGNHLLYWQNGVRLWMMTPSVSTAREHYSQMKQVFPYEGTLDAAGIALSLECGRPEEAKDLLKEAKESVRRKWTSEVESALRARTDSLAEVKNAKAALADQNFSSVVHHLERAHDRYRSDPLVGLNLGLVYQRVGRYQNAADILQDVLGRVPRRHVAVTAANAAFSKIKLGSTEDAVSLLSIVASAIGIGADGPVAVIAVDDLPGIALWVDDDGVRQSSRDETNRIVAEIVTSTGGVQALPPRVADLVEFYEAAQGL